MEDGEQRRIREAEAEFRAAVQREQAELMAAGAGRGEVHTGPKAASVSLRFT